MLALERVFKDPDQMDDLDRVLIGHLMHVRGIKPVTNAKFKKAFEAAYAKRKGEQEKSTKPFRVASIG